MDASQHRGLVVTIALRYLPTLPEHMTLDDAISAGNLGLVQAASRFDDDRKGAWTTFAGQRIAGAIMDEVRTRLRTEYRYRPLVDDRTEVPHDALPDVDAHAYVLGRLSQLSDREEMVIRWYYLDGISLSEIAQRLELTKDRINQVKAKALRELRRQVCHAF